MSFETLRFEEHKAPNGQKYISITMNRPQAMNALNGQVLKELDQALSKISEDSKVRALILTGEGKAFVAGADISEFKDLDAGKAQEMSERGQRLFQKLEDMEIPTLAAVNGFALGGGLELALSCDMLIASSKAKWGLPEVTLGLLPGYGGTQRLSLKTNFGVAKRATLTGEMFSAEQGEKWGLFTQICEPEQLLEEAHKIAGNICERAPIAVRMAKACINVGF
ncbi:MAG TPA: crotonase, partial [Bdellovibrionales bacterium]|nr:crotonase [Bdellovibrionales bacterium]